MPRAKRVSDHSAGLRCHESTLHVCEHIVGYKDPARPGYDAIHCGKVFCDDCGDHGESDCCEECRAKIEAEFRAEYEAEKALAVRAHGSMPVPDGHANYCTRWLGGDCDCVLAYID